MLCYTINDKESIIDKEETMSKNDFPSKRAQIYKDIPDEKWNDWRWQLSHRLNSTADFNGVINLTESEKRALDASGLFR